LYGFDDEKTQQKQDRLDRLQLLIARLTRWRRLVASNKALNLLYRVMRAVLYQRTTAAIKMASHFGYILLLLICLLLPWRLLGQYRASSCPMASSGFRSSPGHAALGDALCIPPADCHGHQNGQQWRNMLMPLLVWSLAITIAKYHVLVIIN
jgi:hypothetical protein